MANIKSQKKRVLTNEKAHLRNVAVKSGLKTAIRATREAIAAGDKAAAEAAYKSSCGCALKITAVAEGDNAKAAELAQVANRALDKAVSKGVIHKNQAANRKSGLAVAISAL